MKSTIRIKTINGKEYWYEDIPYYDKEKKQIRHRSKYLGKNIDGQPVRVRDEPMVPVAKTIIDAPIGAYTHGNLLPLQKITQELSLQSTLEEFLNADETDVVLALAYNRVLRPLALQNVQTWFEGSSLFLQNPHLPLASQRLSEILASLGKSNVPTLFMDRFTSLITPNATLFYDITSLSSSSQLLELLEYGYNRDSDGLPQVNISLVMDKDRGIPIQYDLYPGSIADIGTLANMLRRLKTRGISQFRLILDRGFFSQTSLAELLDEEIPFIIPPTLQLTSVKELLSKAQKQVAKAEYLHKYEKEAIFAMPVTLSHLYELEEEPRVLTVKGYCYYDPQREQDERSSFYRHLYDVAEKLRNAQPKAWKRPDVVVGEIAGHYARYLTWKFADGRFEVAIKQKAVTQRVNRMGRFILLYSGDMDWLTCLTQYRQRDAIEKCYDVMKNDLKALPLNLRTEETLRGYLFITFLALVLRMRLQMMMKETGLIKQYSVQKLLLELEKIKVVELSSGEMMVSEVSKKNRTILEAFDLCA
ncbi:IS1634 family transposase [Methanoculleus sp. UBA303]|jgi:transposase|uniref:IS1634 family transposase n=1 Tax=Methanoculleus sp. UBA303 TaxID=1915497 RepID=UPI0025FDD7C9|nr:IS1634 family transposase [Methanoculleus sp. UBA303]